STTIAKLRRTSACAATTRSTCQATLKLRAHPGDRPRHLASLDIGLSRIVHVDLEAEVAPRGLSSQVMLNRLDAVLVELFAILGNYFRSSARAIENIICLRAANRSRSQIKNRIGMRSAANQRKQMIFATPSQDGLAPLEIGSPHRLIQDVAVVDL